MPLRHALSPWCGLLNALRCKIESRSEKIPSLVAFSLSGRDARWYFIFLSLLERGLGMVTDRAVYHKFSAYKVFVGSEWKPLSQSNMKSNKHLCVQLAVRQHQCSPREGNCLLRGLRNIDFFVRGAEEFYIWFRVHLTNNSHSALRGGWNSSPKLPPLYLYTPVKKVVQLVMLCFMFDIWTTLFSKQLGAFWYWLWSKL